MSGSGQTLLFFYDFMINKIIRAYVKCRPVAADWTIPDGQLRRRILAIMSAAHQTTSDCEEFVVEEMVVNLYMVIVNHYSDSESLLILAID